MSSSSLDATILSSDSETTSASSDSRRSRIARAWTATNSTAALTEPPLRTWMCHRPSVFAARSPDSLSLTSWWWTPVWESPLASPRALASHPPRGSTSTVWRSILCSAPCSSSTLAPSVFRLIRPIESSSQASRTSGSLLPVGIGDSDTLSLNMRAPRAFRGTRGLATARC